MPRTIDKRAAATRAEIRELVVRAYVRANHAQEPVVRRGFDGSDDVDVDSQIGVELLAAVEEEYGVYIPSEESLSRTQRPTLRAYADLIEQYVGKPGTPGPTRVHPKKAASRRPT